MQYLRNFRNYFLRLGIDNNRVVSFHSSETVQNAIFSIRNSYQRDHQIVLENLQVNVNTNDDEIENDSDLRILYKLGYFTGIIPFNIVKIEDGDELIIKTNRIQQVN